jgi:hypothetical protein
MSLQINAMSLKHVTYQGNLILQQQAISLQWVEPCLNYVIKKRHEKIVLNFFSTTCPLPVFFKYPQLMRIIKHDKQIL